jgi:hypothetical protein
MVQNRKEGLLVWGLEWVLLLNLRLELVKRLAFLLEEQEEQLGMLEQVLVGIRSLRGYGHKGVVLVVQVEQVGSQCLHDHGWEVELGRLVVEVAERSLAEV